MHKSNIHPAIDWYIDCSSRVWVRPTLPLLRAGLIRGIGSGTETNNYGAVIPQSCITTYHQPEKPSRLVVVHRLIVPTIFGYSSTFHCANDAAFQYPSKAVQPPHRLERPKLPYLGLRVTNLVLPNTELTLYLSGVPLFL